MREAYLVYRPALEYEESLEPYFICDTKEQANKCVEVMHRYVERLLARLPKYPDESAFEEHEQFLDAWSSINTKRLSILARCRWPFDIDLENKVIYGSSTWDRNAIDVMKLPVWRTI